MTGVQSIKGPAQRPSLSAERVLHTAMRDRILHINWLLVRPMNMDLLARR